MTKPKTSTLERNTEDDETEDASGARGGDAAHEEGSEEEPWDPLNDKKHVTCLSSPWLNKPMYSSVVAILHMCYCSGNCYV